MITCIFKRIIGLDYKKIWVRANEILNYSNTLDNIPTSILQRTNNIKDFLDSNLY